MTKYPRGLWVGVDKSADLLYWRRRAAQLERALVDLGKTMAKQQDMLLRMEQEIQYLKHGRKKRWERRHHDHGLRGRHPQANLKTATRPSSSDKKRRRPSKSPTSSSYS